MFPLPRVLGTSLAYQMLVEYYACLVLAGLALPLLQSNLLAPT